MFVHTLYTSIMIDSGISGRVCEVAQDLPLLLLYFLPTEIQ